MKKQFKGIYKDKTVFVTGHTGFKGSWLIMWLEKLGAKVVGYSLPAVNSDDHFNLITKKTVSYFQDIRNHELLSGAIEQHQPDIIFHLAAQSLVLKSYSNPIETYQTNVLGTLNVYEAAKNCKNVKAIVSITTDKVYENNEQLKSFKEDDPLGGHDMYSSSKACCEILSQSFRKSFLENKTDLLLATARAGNVIGGGDWAENRIIPDIIRAIRANKKLTIRNPDAIRPWQHILEPLAGYLLLGQKLLEGDTNFAQAWNFGPEKEDCKSVSEILAIMQNHFPELDFIKDVNKNKPHEAGILQLDCTKAKQSLNWQPLWAINTAIEKTANWYKEFINNKVAVSEKQIDEYWETAIVNKAVWIQ